MENINDIASQMVESGQCIRLSNKISENENNKIKEKGSGGVCACAADRFFDSIAGV